MARSRKSKGSGSSKARYGEGKEAAPIVRDGDRAAMTVEVSADELDPPDRSVAANFATATWDGDQIFLLFSQRAPGAEVPQASLFVSVPVQSVQDLLREKNPAFVTGCLDFVTSRGYTTDPREYRAELAPAGRTLFEHASVISLTYSETEADIRLWRVQPSVLRQVSPKTIVNAIHPVVTIYLSTMELARLLRALDGVLDEASA